MFRSYSPWLLRETDDLKHNGSLLYKRVLFSPFMEENTVFCCKRWSSSSKIPSSKVRQFDLFLYLHSSQ